MLKINIQGVLIAILANHPTPKTNYNPLIVSLDNIIGIVVSLYTEKRDQIFSKMVPKSQTSKLFSYEQALNLCIAA